MKKQTPIFLVPSQIFAEDDVVNSPNISSLSHHLGLIVTCLSFPYQFLNLHCSVVAKR